MSKQPGVNQGPNWGLILGLVFGAVVALAIFIPAIVTTLRTRPANSPVTTPDATTSALSLPGPNGGSNVSMDVNTLVGKPAPTFTLSDSDGLSFPVSPGGGTRTVLIFNMGVT